MKLTGEYLKKHREAKNISLEQASLVTKIGVTTLKAIETSNFKKLPPKSYLRGFVFSYGSFLGVDKDKLSQLFAEEMGSTNPEVQQEVIQKQTWQTIPVINKVKINAKTFIACGLVAMLVLAFAIQSLIKKYQNEQIIIPESTNISEVNKIKHDNPIIKVTPTDTKTPAQPTIDKPEVEARPAVEAVAKPTKKITNTTITSNTVYSNPRSYKELVVEATKDTSITIKIGNNNDKVIKLLNGDFHTIKARSKLTLITKDPEAIKLIYNGTLQTKNLPSDKNQFSVTY